MSTDRIGIMEATLPVTKEFLDHVGLVFAKLANVGRFLREQGYYREAAECFSTLSAGDETFETGDYAYELGLCLKAMGDVAEARRYFEIAVRENPAILKFRTEAAACGITLPPDPTTE